MVRGKTMLPSSRYCFHCHKDARYSFLPIDETSTTSVESEMGGFYEGYQKIVVKKIKEWNENDDDLDICDETTWSIIIKAINSLGLPELR